MSCFFFIQALLCFGFGAAFCEELQLNVISNIIASNEYLQAQINRNKKTCQLSGISGGSSQNKCIQQYKLGQFVEELGGIIIWLTSDNKHGLIGAVSDASMETFAWSILDNPVATSSNYPPYYFNNTTPYKESISGYINQQSIQQQPNWETNYPAFKAAADYNGYGFNDWFLPGVYELTALLNYFNQGLSSIYWSSSSWPSPPSGFASYVTSSNNSMIDVFSSPYFVRCVRAF